MVSIGGGWRGGRTAKPSWGTLPGVTWGCYCGSKSRPGIARLCDLHLCAKREGRRQPGLLLFACIYYERRVEGGEKEGAHEGFGVR